METDVWVTDFWDPKYYDLIINTYSHGPLETLDLVLQALGYFPSTANRQRNKIFRLHRRWKIYDFF